MYIYVGTNDNQLIVYEVVVENEAQERFKEIQRINPLIDLSILTTDEEEERLSSVVPKVSTIIKNPYHPLLYVFTSFGSYHQSIVTTFQIHNNNNNNFNSNDVEDNNNHNNGRHLERLLNHGDGDSN